MSSRQAVSIGVKPWTIPIAGPFRLHVRARPWMIATWWLTRLAVRNWKVTVTLIAWTVGVIHWGQWLLPTILTGLAWAGVFTVRLWWSRRGDRTCSGDRRVNSLQDTVKTASRRARLTRSWKQAAEAAGITIGRGDEQRVPDLTRVRATDRGFTAEVKIAGVSKGIEDLVAKASVIADTVGALDVEIGRARPGVMALTFHYDDALAAVVKLQDLPTAPTGQIAFGVHADGRASCLDPFQSVLIAGVTRSGKSGVLWALLAGLLAAGIPTRVRGIDPKGGMELGALMDELRQGDLEQRGLTVEDYVSTVTDSEELIAKMADGMHRRAAKLAARKVRKHKPTRSEPLELLVIDEGLTLAPLMKKGAESPLGEIAFMGAACGYVVIILSQVGQADALGRFRDLIPQRVCLRTKNREGTDAVLGSGAEGLGARCSRISPTTQGVGYIDTTDGFQRFRAAWVDDDTARVIASGQLPAGMKTTRGERTGLYRWKDDQGDLLYVGISNHPELRAQQHDQTKDWFHLVATSDVEWFPSREDALKAEKAAIIAERPRYNKQHNQRVRRLDKLRSRA